MPIREEEYTAYRSKIVDIDVSGITSADELSLAKLKYEREKYAYDRVVGAEMNALTNLATWLIVNHEHIFLTSDISKGDKAILLWSLGFGDKMLKKIKD